MSPGGGPIQADEIAAAIPTEGIKIGDLMKMFSSRVGDKDQQTTKKDFINLVKANSAYGADRLLRPKP
jgi:transcription initiation factor TFIIF subunit alpha